MVFTISEKLKAPVRIATYVLVLLLGIGYAVLYITSLDTIKLTEQVSVTNCPDNVNYDPYFCSGVDLTDYSQENSQGRPDGYEIQMGPLTALNINFTLGLLLTGDSSLNNMQFSFEGELYGTQNDDKTNFQLIHPIMYAGTEGVDAEHNAFITLVNQERAKYRYLMLKIQRGKVYTGELKEASVQIITYKPEFGALYLSIKFVCATLAMGAAAVLVLLAFFKKMPVKYNTTFMTLILVVVYVNPLDLVSDEYDNYWVQLGCDLLKSLAITTVSCFNQVKLENIKLWECITTTALTFAVCFVSEALNILTANYLISPTTGKWWCICPAVLGLVLFGLNLVIAIETHTSSEGDFSRRTAVFPIFYGMICLAVVLLTVVNFSNVASSLQCLDFLVVEVFLMQAVWEWPMPRLGSQDEESMGLIRK